MDQQVPSFVELLSRKHRVILLGGLAVIAHGRDRHTSDVDIWLDPLDSSDDWASAVLATRSAFPKATIHRLPGWLEIPDAQVADAVEEIGMIRIMGLGCPLDIFRRPNEFEEHAFDDVFRRATRNKDGTYLPDPLDLLQSKLDTHRDKDQHDILHLESLVRRSYSEVLPTASPAEAATMLDRFADWQVLRAALENPDPVVGEIARGYLQEFAALGDPFSKAILDGQEIPE